MIHIRPLLIMVPIHENKRMFHQTFKCIYCNSTGSSICLFQWHERSFSVPLQNEHHFLACQFLVHCPCLFKVDACSTESSLQALVYSVYLFGAALN